MWSNDQVQIKKTKSGKPFGVSTTFVAYDFCTLVFHTDISIPKNNSIVEITIYGNTEKIRGSLNDSSMMLIYKDRCFTKDGIDKLSELLTTGQGTPEVRDWYDSANHIIDTLEY